MSAVNGIGMGGFSALGLGVDSGFGKPDQLDELEELVSTFLSGILPAVGDNNIGEITDIVVESIADDIKPDVTGSGIGQLFQNAHKFELTADLQQQIIGIVKESPEVQNLLNTEQWDQLSKKVNAIFQL